MRHRGPGPGVGGAHALGGIVGIDPVQAFLECARSRFADPRMAFDRGTAVELPYPDASFGDYRLPLLGGVGPVGACVARLAPGQRDALRGALRGRPLPGRPDGRISLVARAWAVRGTVRD